MVATITKNSEIKVNEKIIKRNMKRKQRNDEIKRCKELGIEIHKCRLLSAEVVQILVITNNTGTPKVLTMVSLKIIIPFQIHNID